MSQGELDEIVFVVEEDADAGGYVAACSRLGIHTQGDDPDELRRMVVDAVECRLEGEPAKPARIRLHSVRNEVIAA